MRVADQPSLKTLEDSQYREEGMINPINLQVLLVELEHLAAHQYTYTTLSRIRRLTCIGHFS